MEKSNHTIIPAQPGFNVCVAMEPEDANAPITKFWKTPVIAWSLTVVKRHQSENPLVQVDPVTLEGSVSDYQEYLIESPGGAFSATYVADFADEAQALEYIKNIQKGE